jgi:hypothetical protein
MNSAIIDVIIISLCLLLYIHIGLGVLIFMCDKTAGSLNRSVIVLLWPIFIIKHYVIYIIETITNKGTNKWD